MMQTFRTALSQSLPRLATQPVVCVNVASVPFRRERAKITLLSFTCILLACCLVILSGVAVYRYAQAQRVQQQLKSDMARLMQVETEQRHYASLLSRSQNSDVFSWSAFFNQVIDRRSVSWSRVFGDLASVMPDRMRLVGIRSPQVRAEESGTNHILLDMVVASDQPDVLVSFLNNLRASALFGPAKVMSRAPPAEHEQEYKFRVLVAYAQKL